LRKNYQTITRAGLLLALTILFQSLRSIIPIPPFLSIFLIGSLVNCCLLVAVEVISRRAAFVIAIIAPVVAYLQQLLPLPIFILPVAIGNAIYVGVFAISLRWNWLGRAAAAALAKSVFMYITFIWLLSYLALPEKITANLIFVMSWPQFVTGILGAWLAAIITMKLKNC